jgi:hypothetical protein
MNSQASIGAFYSMEPFVKAMHDDIINIYALENRWMTVKEFLAVLPKYHLDVKHSWQPRITDELYKKRVLLRSVLRYPCTCGVVGCNHRAAYSYKLNPEAMV